MNCGLSGKKPEFNLKRRFAVFVFAGVCLLSLSGYADNQPVKGVYPTVGQASWYDPNSTSPELFHKWGMTCAMRRTDYGKYYRVCNLSNNKCVFVRHNDFGPSEGMYRRGRIIDLSKAAFRKIADLSQGVIRVEVTQVYNAPVD